MTLLEEIIDAVNEWSQQLQQFQQLHPQEGSRLSVLEKAAQQLGRKVAQLSLQSCIKEADDSPGLSSLDCSCGKGRLVYQRQSRRLVRSLVGELSYQRAYYYCRACRANSFPLDDKLGQSQREISAGVERALAMLSAHPSFSTAAMLLEEIGQVSLSSRQVETVAEAVGQQAEQIEQSQAEQSSQQGMEEVVGPQAEKASKRIWIVEMDGVMAPMRGGTSSEVKVGIIYGLEKRVEISKDRWELVERQRCEYRGGCQEFRQRLWAMILRVGVRAADRIVVIGDGAEWIDQTVELMFYGATRIMDFYHLAQRIWAVAGARYGEASQQGSQWAHEKLSLMKAGQIERVIRALRQLKMEEGEGEARRAEAVGYIKKNRAGMAYDQYKAENLPIGSGAIEGSCKHLVTARCKQAGMRWSEAGVDAILALRCWVLNGRLDELRPKPQIEIEWAKAA